MYVCGQPNSYLWGNKASMVFLTIQSLFINLGLGLIMAPIILAFMQLRRDSYFTWKSDLTCIIPIWAFDRFCFKWFPICKFGLCALRHCVSTWVVLHLPPISSHLTHSAHFCYFDMSHSYLRLGAVLHLLILPRS